MAKTGDGESLGTAEGAVLGRAAHTLHAKPPVLADSWAIELLGEEAQARARDPESDARVLAATGIDFRLILAVGIGSLRYAEDEVDRCLARGIDQYVILGAGFDTFALRRGDVVDRLRVFEVDFPDVQALKRARIEAASAEPAQLPTFVPVDFETMKTSAVLPTSQFDATRPSVWSWMNTLPYLTEEATAATLEDLRPLLASGSRLVLNYPADVPASAEQADYLARIEAVTRSGGEPWSSRWAPETFEALVERLGYRVVERTDEDELNARYFAEREDGMHAGVPVRLVTLEAD